MQMGVVPAAFQGRRACDNVTITGSTITLHSSSRKSRRAVESGVWKIKATRYTLPTKRPKYRNMKRSGEKLWVDSFPFPFPGEQVSEEYPVFSIQVQSSSLTSVEVPGVGP